MGRFKIKKQDTFIDMTPMSDVMVLLLTFFMLTATFVKEEPVKVNAPGSVSEVKIPENNLLTIFVEKSGKVFMCMDNPIAQGKLVDRMIENGAFDLTAKEKETLSQAPTFGTPIDYTKDWLNKDNATRTHILTDPNSQIAGIPCDSIDDELKIWVKAARDACGDGMSLAIKADQATSYAVIKRVMDSLREVDENRYNLITSLKTGED